MANLYNLGNDYFMAHQPAFMLGMIAGFFALVVAVGLYDSHCVRRANRKG